jgi:hypothetical protein
MSTLPLKHPIPLGKTTISKLQFRDYTIAADYLSFDQRGGVAQRIALIASLTGTDEALIKQLRGPDYRAAEKMADELITADEEDANQGEGGAEKKSSES